MKKIGFWDHNSVPVSDTPMEQKEEFLNRLASIEEHKASVSRQRGLEACLICGSVNSLAEYSFGNFTWPSSYSHYIREHNVKPDEDFFRFVMAPVSSAVKTIFGHVSDGPSTTLMPDTLEVMLKEQGINSGIIEEIMATINAQSMVKYSEGYADGKEKL